MTDSAHQDRRLQIAAVAYDLIETEIRPHLQAGGRLWSKGSRGYPTLLRQIRSPLDDAHTVTSATDAAMQLDERERAVEHVIPLKRVIIELDDPRQADPRANSHNLPIADGPATSPEHLISIYDRLLTKCWVTPEEHARLNRADKSSQWDAPDGDGWARYRAASVVARPLATG